MARASVIVSAISGRDLPNAVATSSTTNVRTKKSNASSVQPRNPASTALRWLARSAFVIETGEIVAMRARGLYFCVMLHTTIPYNAIKTLLHHLDTRYRGI